MSELFRCPTCGKVTDLIDISKFPEIKHKVFRCSRCKKVFVDKDDFARLMQNEIVLRSGDVTFNDSSTAKETIKQRLIDYAKNNERGELI